MAGLVDRLATKALSVLGPPPVRQTIGTRAAPPIAARILPWTEGKPQWVPATSRNMSEMGYEKIALVFRCIGLTASSVSVAPVRIYDDATGQRELVERHDARPLLARPNPRRREKNFWAWVGLSCAATGFALVEKERSAQGYVVGLWPLRSDWARPIPRYGRPPDWEYTIGGSTAERMVLDSDDVMVFTYQDRLDLNAVGIGPLEVVFRDCGILNKLTDFLKVFFDRGAMPVYGIIPDLIPGQELDQEQKDKFRRDWVRRHAGLERSLEPAVMTGVKDLKRLSFDFDELALTDIRDVSELAICQAFGIPAVVAGARFGLARSTGDADYETSRQSMYEETIVPLWGRWEDTVTLDLLREFPPVVSTQFAAFDTSQVQALQENRNDKAVWLNVAVEAGSISVHTYHRELNLPVPDGDDYYLTDPENIRGFWRDGLITRQVAQERLRMEVDTGEHGSAYLLPLGAQEIAPDDPLANQLAHLDEGGDVRTGLVAIGPGGEQLPIVDLSRRSSSTPPVEGRRSLSRETRSAIGDAHRTLIVRIADRSAPAIEDYLSGLQDRVLAAATRSGRAPEWIAAIRRVEALPVDRRAAAAAAIGRDWIGAGDRERRDLAELDWAEENRLLAGVLGELYTLAGQAAFRSAAQTLGVSLSFDLSNLNVRNILRELGLRITNVTASTQAAIAELVTQAALDGFDLDELSTRIAKLGAFQPWRALMIARTESQVAFNSAAVLGYRETGLVDRVELLDNPNHTDEPGSDGLTCAQRNGLIVPLDDAAKHIEAEHPNGTLAVAGVLEGDE